MVQFDAPPKDPRSYMDAEFSMHESDAKPTPFRTISVGKEATKMRGVITVMAGGVRVLKKGAPDWHYAKLKDVLEEGDKVETAQDGRVNISFENGNLLDLQNNSRILLATLRKDPKTGEFENTFESDGGKIKAVVEKLGKKSAFRVKTPTALCGVRGTVMYVNVAAGATQAFYEGGGGTVTNPVSGDTAFVESGQNTVSTGTGQISAPVTTSVEAKMTLSASYDYGVVQDNYAAPENAAAGTGGNASGMNGAKMNTAADLDTGTGGGGFNPPPDLVPITERNQPKAVPGVSYIERLSFAGLIGRVDNKAAFSAASPANPVNGSFSLSVSVNSEWLTVGQGSVSGYISSTDYVPSSYAFWMSENVKCSTSNNGQYRGYLGSCISTSNSSTETTLWGKALCLYRDPSGWAGTMTFLYGGKYYPSSKYFQSELPASGDVVFTAREFVGSNYDLNSQTLITGTMYGRGTGTFDGGGVVACIDDDPLPGDFGLSGVTFDIDTDWGIWQFNAQGTYSGTTSDIWTLAVGGEREGGSSNPTYWMGTIDGNKWDDRSTGVETNQATGEFGGVFFYKSGASTFEGGTILNGHIVGITNPSGSPDKTWQAIGGGEFLVAYKGFTAANLGFTASELSTFVSVPITQAAASTNMTRFSGSSQFTTFNMDTRVYQSGTSYMWGGTISGAFLQSAQPEANWTVTLTGTTPNASSITLSSGTWDVTQKLWSATVDPGGTVGARTISGGQAGGIIIMDGDNSTFEGVAAGKAT
jgi:hypothetical protein